MKIIEQSGVVSFEELYACCGEDGQTPEEFAEVLIDLVDKVSPVEGFSHLQVVDLSDKIEE